MLKIGITGGIGSGKSIVARIFQTLGIPVLDADAFAKQLMAENDKVRLDLIEAFGAEVFDAGQLNRAFLSQLVFNDPVHLNRLNGIVHPAVKQYGTAWMEQQHAPYVLKEAALFFESGSYTDMDYMIGVFSPLEQRIERAMKRDGATRDAILKRIDKQMNEDEKMSRCDFVIYNDGSHSLIEQVLHLHHQFLEQTK